MKQVNATYDFISDTLNYWIGEYCKDGYQGRLTDTVYEGGASYTDWCLFVSDNDDELNKFIDICKTKGETEARKWADNIAHAAFVAKFGELPTL